MHDPDGDDFSKFNRFLLVHILIFGEIFMKIRLVCLFFTWKLLTDRGTEGQTDKRPVLRNRLGGGNKGSASR